MEINPNLREIINSCNILAESMKIQYEAYLRAGFTPERAMKLVLNFQEQVLLLGKGAD